MSVTTYPLTALASKKNSTLPEPHVGFVFGPNLLLVLLVMAAIGLPGCDVLSSGSKCPSLGEEIPGTRVFVPMGETVPYWSYDVRVSPDGRLLAFSNRGALTLHDLTTEEQTAIASGRNPSWSPGGNWIAFSSGVQIFKVKADGDSLTQLTDQGLNFFPAWSLDGRRIAYDRSVADDHGPSGVWLMTINGTDKKALHINGRSPFWHPSQNRIVAWVSGGLAIYDFDQARIIQRLDAFPGDRNRRPQFSPDGELILVHNIEGAWIINQRGGKPRGIATTCTRDGVGRRIDAATWHPDGKHIIIQEFYITDVSGLEPHDFEGPRYEGYASFRKVAVPASYWR